ncbi:hypothetical protein BpHYR1_010461 [Brachionus plicatilis]|uniref:Secreted protein n=1 Tax=Brachionus plicatilis TaxID=10195 RepID=A0A3M7SL93_BRAPC|nr:hypothetical protein BpHYR1_010461 [Brachionus plicatilis]
MHTVCCLVFIGVLCRVDPQYFRCNKNQNKFDLMILSIKIDHKLQIAETVLGRHIYFVLID